MPSPTSATVDAMVAAPIVHNSVAAYGTSASGPPSARLTIVNTYAAYVPMATTSMIHARFSWCVISRAPCVKLL